MNLKFFISGEDGKRAGAASLGGSWCLERLVLGDQSCFIVSHCESGLILGFVLVSGEGLDVRGFLGELLGKNKHPTALFSTESGLLGWCSENGISFVDQKPEAGGWGEAFEFGLIEAVSRSTLSQYKKWRSSLPKYLKHKKVPEKVRSVEFKDFLYSSLFFKAAAGGLLKSVVMTLNESRQPEGFVRVKDSPSGALIKPDSNETSKFETIGGYFKRLFDETSPAHRPLLKAIYASFTLQSKQLLELESLKLKMEELVAYKRRKEAEQAAKAARRRKRLARQKRNPTQPFRKEYLAWVLDFVDKKKKFSFLTKIRLKVAMVFLVLTGVRVSEIRLLKVSSAVELFEKGFLKVNLLKGGSQGHKVFLRPAGVEFLKRYRAAFIDLMVYQGLTKRVPSRKKMNIEPAGLNLYLFSNTKSRGRAPLSRSFFTRQINEVLQTTPQLVERGIRLTSHSFRHGFITELWAVTGDIEFVSQVVGHSSPGVSSGYIQKLSDEDRRQRLQST